MSFSTRFGVGAAPKAGAFKERFYSLSTDTATHAVISANYIKCVEAENKFLTEILAFIVEEEGPMKEKKTTTTIPLESGVVTEETIEHIENIKEMVELARKHVQPDEAAVLGGVGSLDIKGSGTLLCSSAVESTLIGFYNNADLNKKFKDMKGKHAVWYHAVNAPFKSKDVKAIQIHAANMNKITTDMASSVHVFQQTMERLVRDVVAKQKSEAKKAGLVVTREQTRNQNQAQALSSKAVQPVQPSAQGRSWNPFAGYRAAPPSAPGPMQPYQGPPYNQDFVPRQYQASPHNQGFMPHQHQGPPNQQGSPAATYGGTNRFQQSVRAVTAIDAVQRHTDAKHAADMEAMHAQIEDMHAQMAVSEAAHAETLASRPFNTGSAASTPVDGDGQ